MSPTPTPTAWLGHPFAFAAITFAWSWGFWIPSALLGGVATPAGGVFAIAGLLGPLVGGFTCTWLTQGLAGWRDYWRRVVDVRRIGWFGLAFIVVLPPTLIAASVALDSVTGGTGGRWEPGALAIAAEPWRLLPFVLPILLIGPAEEFGWRGYWQARLQLQYGPVFATLVLGVTWALWHLPLFLMAGTYQSELGLFTSAFWLFMFGIVPLTFAFTLLFNRTGFSTLAAMLLHFMVNFVGQLVALSQGAETWSIVLWTVVAIVATIIGLAPRDMTLRVADRKTLADGKQSFSPADRSGPGLI